MKDRVPTKPNRYAVYDDNHNFIRYEYHERADEPTEVGTPLSKGNLLSDQTAAALAAHAGAPLPPNPTVNNAFEALAGVPMLYRKIRDIPNTGATNSISIDLSDLDWDEWQEIRLIGDFSTQSSQSTILINNRTSEYRCIYLNTGSPPSGDNYGESALKVTANNSYSNISFFVNLFQKPLSTTAVSIFGTARAHNLENSTPGSAMRAAIFSINQTTNISSLTINIVASTTGSSISLSNAKLWGIKK